MSTETLVEAEKALQPHILASVLDFVQDDLNAVDTLLIERTEERVPLIPLMTKHLLNAGGKRLRPVLTLLTARWFDYQGADHIKLAAAVESIHTATLLHDDVIDQSAMRRGNPSANAEWGNKPSILVGDYLLSLSFQLMVETESLPILKTLSDAAAQITEGEVHQLEVSHDLALTEAGYMKVITAKTAVLFAAACRVGGELVHADASTLELLEQFGLKLGVAFQMVDDVLDYSSENSTLGKSVGDDFKEGKVTLPVILAYQRGSEEEKNFWNRTMMFEEHCEGDFALAMGYLTSHGACDHVLALAATYLDDASRLLQALPDHPVRGLMEDIIQFCRIRCS